MSTKPGHATSPLASIFFADFFSAVVSDFTRIPLRTKRSPFPSRFEAGSITRAFLIQSVDIVDYAPAIACSGRPPEQRYNTAIRTAIPLETCSRITLREPSAKSLSISTPRLIGPGCMIIALG